jgi:hypothetical protein
VGIGILLSVLLGADMLVTYGVIARHDSFEAGKVWHCLHSQDQSIPVFGASNIRAAFAPKESGLELFNYAMNGSSYEVTDVLLRAELHKPKTTPVVIGMSYHVFHDVGDVSKFIPVAWNGDVREALFSTHAMSWRFLIPGLRYFGYYDWYLKDYVSDLLQTTRRVDRGYEYKFNALPFNAQQFAGAVQKRRETGYGYSEDPEATKTLTERIRSAPNRKFILVYPPIHESCFERFEGWEKFQAALQYWRNLPNVVVLDYSNLRYPDMYFVDTMHLNQRGAAEFSRLFGQDFQRVTRDDHTRVVQQ